MSIAGTFRHKVNVHAPPGEGDTRGQTDPHYGPIVIEKLPCSIEPLSGRELEIARQKYEETTHEVKFYANPKVPVTAEHWLMWGTRRLEIGSSLTDTRGLITTLLCSEN